jgi:hypothetical protein
MENVPGEAEPVGDPEPRPDRMCSHTTDVAGFFCQPPIRWVTQNEQHNALIERSGIERHLAAMGTAGDHKVLEIDVRLWHLVLIIDNTADAHAQAVK